MFESNENQASNGNTDGSRLLLVDPYRSLRAHFGMLLGVSDVEAIDAYHRGKMWLHNAWLHGSGVIWGYKVELDLDHGEVRVAPGLALDRLGRELHLDQDLCLNVVRWFEEYQGADLDVTHPGDDEQVSVFDVHVVARFNGCLTRPVPALSEPCEDTKSITSYSRIFETVELCMLPGTVDDHPGPLPYHRLRLLFGVDQPVTDSGIVISSDQQVLDRLATVNSPTAMLDAFRDFAALDTLELQPAASGDGEPRSLFPSSAVDVVLANISQLRLERSNGQWTLVGSAPDSPDNTVRHSIVATSTIQELMCGNRAPVEGGEAAITPGAAAIRDAGGPRIDPDDVEIDADGTVITFVFDQEVLTNSVKEPAVEVHSFGTSAGWRRENITIDFDRSPNRATITIVDPHPDADTLRLAVRGTGESPVLGGGRGRRVPFAGVVGGPPGTQHNGHDFYHMFKLAE